MGGTDTGFDVRPSGPEQDEAFHDVECRDCLPVRGAYLHPMGESAEAHGVPSPGKVLPDGPPVAARLYDHVVLALVDTDMINVAGQITGVMEKHQVTWLRLRMRFPVELMKLFIGRPLNPLAVTVPVGVLGEAGAIHTPPRGTAPLIRHPLQRDCIAGDPHIRGDCMHGR